MGCPQGEKLVNDQGRVYIKVGNTYGHAVLSKVWVLKDPTNGGQQAEENNDHDDDRRDSDECSS